MYVNRKDHFLTNSLFWAAGIHMAAYVIMIIVRRIARAQNATVPDMENGVIWATQIAVSALLVLAMAFVFVRNFEKLRKAMSVVDESDHLRMAVLQKEVMGSKVPALTGDSIGKLLELWGAILVGIRMVYDICSMVYRRFIADLMDFSEASETTTEEFVAIYNNTHGFKYVGLLIALLIGVLMTGIFLNDRLLKVITLILMTFFLFSFVLLGMHTFSVGGYSVGIVWTLVIFHLVETLGLFFMGLYLRKKYIGL